MILTIDNQVLIQSMFVYKKTVSNSFTPNLNSISESKHVQQSTPQHSSTRIVRIKWFILLATVYCWFAQLHCVASIAVLEDTLLSHYNLSNTEYSLLYTSLFFLSIPGCLLGPTIVEKYDLYTTLIISQVICTIGQAICAIGSISADYNYNAFINTRSTDHNLYCNIWRNQRVESKLWHFGKIP